MKKNEMYKRIEQQKGFNYIGTSLSDNGFIDKFSIILNDNTFVVEQSVTLQGTQYITCSSVKDWDKELINKRGLILIPTEDGRKLSAEEYFKSHKDIENNIYKYFTTAKEQLEEALKN